MNCLNHLSLQQVTLVPPRSSNAAALMYGHLFVFLMTPFSHYATLKQCNAMTQAVALTVSS